MLINPARHYLNYGERVIAISTCRRALRRSLFADLTSILKPYRELQTHATKLPSVESLFTVDLDVTGSGHGFKSPARVERHPRLTWSREDSGSDSGSDFNEFRCGMLHIYSYTSSVLLCFSSSTGIGHFINLD